MLTPKERELLRQKMIAERLQFIAELEQELKELDAWLLSTESWTAPPAVRVAATEKIKWLKEDVDEHRRIVELLRMT